MRSSLLTILVLAVSACNSPSVRPAQFSWQTVPARSGIPTYRAQVPKNWVEHLTLGRDDTTIPVVWYEVGDARIDVHTFPKMRIPPQAQVRRWQGKAGEEGEITPVAHDGFVGLKLKTATMTAWAMQLDQEQVRQLGRDADESADYTIKATGDFQAHLTDIDQFAKSFQLLEAIPPA